MNVEAFNLSIRQFLKHFGVTAQREIEHAVETASAEGRLRGDETLRATATVRLEGIALEHTIEGEIRLG
jgi:Family of unknown function (DUF6494)